MISDIENPEIRDLAENYQGEIMNFIWLNFKQILSKSLDFAYCHGSVAVVDVVWGVFTRYVLGAQAKWSKS